MTVSKRHDERDPDRDVGNSFAKGDVVDRFAAVLKGVWGQLKWIGRVSQGVATDAEVRKAYSDKGLEALWNRLPCAVRSWKVTEAVGRLIHRRVRRVQQRGGTDYTANYTRFFRNLPQLELLREIALEMPRGVPLKLAVLGCSTGAELYSAVWMIRTARADLEVQALGIDISKTCIERASCGVYSVEDREVAGISDTSYERLFSRHGDALNVQHWLKEGVRWWVGDVCSSNLAAHFGLHDIVLANNFLFHMPAERAEECLRAVGRLVAPNGYLFVHGVDLDVRSRTVRELGLSPVTARLEDIYTAEEGMLTAWPLRFWGLEPLDRKRRDWPVRYTTVFRLRDGLRRVRE